MTAHAMAVHGYYAVAGIPRQEYEQGWNVLTLWDGYGLSEATWELIYSQMGVSTPCFAPTSWRTTKVSYQPALRPCPSVRRKTNLFLPIHLLLLTELRRLGASEGGGTSQTSPPPVGSHPRATSAGV